MNQLFTSLLNILLVITVISCQNKEVIPIVKESIDGEITDMTIEMGSNGVGFVYLDILDDTDGKLYEVHMVERGGTPFYNGFAYMDNTNLILPNTKQTPFGNGDFTTAFAVNPIQSTSNAIHISYAQDNSDSRFSTKSITGRITPSTVLIMQFPEENEKEVALLRTDEGIQRFLKPILLNSLNNDFAKDINLAQEGNQVNRFLIYKLNVNSGRKF